MTLAMDHGRWKPLAIVPSSSRVQDGLACLLAESALEVFAIVGGQVVTRDGLTAVLVDSLRNLVSGSISQTREQGEELSSNRGSGMVLENDLVKFADVGNLLHAILSFRPSFCSCLSVEPIIHTLVWLLISRFAIVSTFGSS